MKRKYAFPLIGILIVILILLYLQCQEKKKLISPHKTAEAPAVSPSEKKPGVLHEKTKPEITAPPPVEKVHQEEAEVAHLPEPRLKKPEILSPVKEPEKLIHEPVEEQRTALPEKPDEPEVLHEQTSIMPEKIPGEKIEGKYILPEEVPEQRAIETSPPLQIDSAADPALRIAMLPFENLTDNAGAGRGILPWIKNALQSKGYQIIDDKITSEVLCREHIRLATDLPRDTTRKIGNTLKAASVLAGTIFAYNTGKNPGIGISARLIDATSGSILWANYASDTGEDYTGLLGLGTITSIHTLIPKVADKLISTFQIEQQRVDPESMYRVAVLPFLNLSSNKHAGMVVTHLFIVQLFKNKLFDPVEFGDLRKIILDLRVRSRGELSYKILNDLSSAAGAGVILTGTVEDFSEGISDVYPPKVSISARLLDGSKNKIVWFKGLSLNGEDTITVFEWGKIRSPDKVASVVVSDLVQNMEKTKWH